MPDSYSLMLVVSQGEPCSRTALHFVLNDKDGILSLRLEWWRGSIVVLGMIGTVLSLRLE